MPGPSGRTVRIRGRGRASVSVWQQIAGSSPAMTIVYGIVSGPAVHRPGFTLSAAVQNCMLRRIGVEHRMVSTIAVDKPGPARDAAATPSRTAWIDMARG